MNALDLARQAVSEFRNNNGNESLYLQCQRFDGFYIQATATGDWGSQTYYSAAEAARVARQNGRIYTTDLNDSRIEGLERVYYDWGQYGHVCAVIGRKDGRLVVTNTANSGNNLGDLGNHVKLSFADSLGLPIIGISSRDGNNPHLSGFDLVDFGGGSAPTSPASPSGNRIKLENWAWYASADDAVQLRNPHGKRWTGESYMNGDYAVLGTEGNGAIKVQANDGSTVWVHPSAASNIYSGGGSSTATQWFDVPDGGQYYYNQYENALNGNYAEDQIMYGGSREVVENPGTGPVRVKANDGSLVWVGTRNHPAQVR